MKSQAMVALCSNVPCRVETRHEHVLTNSLAHSLTLSSISRVCAAERQNLVRDSIKGVAGNPTTTTAMFLFSISRPNALLKKIKYIISNRRCTTVYRCICYWKKSLSHTVIGIPTFWKQIKPHIPARHRLPYNRPIASKSTLHRPLHENSSREVNSDRDRPNRALQYL